ncbi:hypothetical protein EGW08_014020, partial [Elysia chlorotica]
DAPAPGGADWKHPGHHRPSGQPVRRHDSGQPQQADRPSLGHSAARFHDDFQERGTTRISASSDTTTAATSAAAATTTTASTAGSSTADCVCKPGPSTWTECPTNSCQVHPALPPGAGCGAGRTQGPPDGAAWGRSGHGWDSHSAAGGHSAARGFGQSGATPGGPPGPSGLARTGGQDTDT